MVSLKKKTLEKEPPIREYSPVHLMNEEEAIRTYCPSKESSAPDIEIVVKQADKAQPLAAKKNSSTKPMEKAPKTFGGLGLSDWCDIIFKTLLIAALIGLIGAVTWSVIGFLGEGLQLSRHLITGG